MNVRKPVNYSAMFAALDTLMAADLPQVELYREIGRLVSGRPEKGAAVAAAEYLSSAYPDASGFSPRNLRRMREIYRTYEDTPEVLAEAMTIGWTQNVVILEAELTLQEKAWYIQAVQQFGWSKLELQRKIKTNAHLETALDFTDDLCYTEENDSVIECENSGENPPYLCKGQVRNEGLSKAEGVVVSIPSWNNGVAICLHRIRPTQPPDWNGSNQPTESAPHLWRRVRGKAPPADRIYRPPKRGSQSIVYRRLSIHLIVGMDAE